MNLGVWTVVGAGIGVAIGAAIHQMGTWLGVGVAIGVSLGVATHKQPGTK